MLNNFQDIKNTLIDCGIKYGDTLFIHGDDIISTQINFKNKSNDPTILFFEALIDLVGDEGTIIVPTFTYSFIKTKKFDVQNSKSEVGTFSEKFRKLSNIVRSKNPIFNVVSIGKKSNQIQLSSKNSSFGKNSVFDLLYKYNAKIFCIGCSFSRITFVHYVEESLKVNYRYHKIFKGEIIENGEKNEIFTDYYVRDLEFDTICNLTKLKKFMINNKKIFLGDFGRLRTYLCTSLDFFESCKEMLKRQEYGLINEGNK